MTLIYFAVVQPVDEWQPPFAGVPLITSGGTAIDSSLQSEILAAAEAANVTLKIGVNVAAPATTGTLAERFFQLANWTAGTYYQAGQYVVNPAGSVVVAIAAFTSGSTYDSTKWSAPTAGGGAVDWSQITSKPTIPPDESAAVATLTTQVSSAASAATAAQTVATAAQTAASAAASTATAAQTAAATAAAAAATAQTAANTAGTNATAAQSVANTASTAAAAAQTAASGAVTTANGASTAVTGATTAATAASTAAGSAASTANAAQTAATAAQTAANAASSTAGSAANTASAAQAAVTTANSQLAVQANLANGLLLMAAADPDDLMVEGTLTLDSNEAPVTFAVIWPDGATGTYSTTTASSAFPGAVDAYTVTHAGTNGTTTYTQPAVTRDASGSLTKRPAIVVSGSVAYAYAYGIAPTQTVDADLFNRVAATAGSDWTPIGGAATWPTDGSHMGIANTATSQVATYLNIDNVFAAASSASISAQLEVDAIGSGAPTPWHPGVILNYTDPNNYYVGVFGVLSGQSVQGNWEILQVFQGVTTVLITGPVITSPTTPYVIKFTQVSNDLVLRCNGAIVARVTDTTPLTGVGAGVRMRGYNGGNAGQLAEQMKVSNWSAGAGVATPLAPASITLAANTSASTSIALSATTTGGTPTAYALYSGTDTTGTLLSTTFPFTVTGLTASTAYSFCATASNSGGLVTTVISATTGAAVATPITATGRITPPATFIGNTSTSTIAVPTDSYGYLCAPVGTPLLNSFWTNVDVTSATVHPNSTAIIAELVSDLSMTGGTCAFNAHQYNTSVVLAPPGTAYQTVGFYNAQNKPLPQTSFAAVCASVPIPSGMVPSYGTDGEVTIIDCTNGDIWDFWQMAYYATSTVVDGVTRPAGWSACWGGKTNAFTGNGTFSNGLGASASGSVIAAGVAGIREMQAAIANGCASLGHALNMATGSVAPAQTYQWPAVRGDGSSGSLSVIAEGQWFRLDPTVDVSKISGLTNIGKVFARTAQQYGIIATDQSGGNALIAESPEALKAAGLGDPWTAMDSPLTTSEDYIELLNFPWRHMQALIPNYGAPSGYETYKVPSSANTTINQNGYLFATCPSNATALQICGWLNLNPAPSVGGFTSSSRNVLDNTGTVIATSPYAGTASQLVALLNADS